MYEITFFTGKEDNLSLKKLLEKHQAEIINSEELKKVRMAYPIKNQDYLFLGVVKFKVDPQSMKGLLEDLKLETGIYRYMINKISERKIEAKTEVSKIDTSVVNKKENLKEEVKRRPEPTLTNEELEKKIEEILK